MEKINLAEILKDCPKGMELDCTMYNKVTLLNVDSEYTCYPIRVKREDGCLITLTKYGQCTDADFAKCVIFPKGKTTWAGFQIPFKDGDIVFYNDTIAIFKEWGDETLFRTYVTKYLCCDFFIDTNVPLFGKSVRKEIRFATEEEKQKLFEAIKDNGYKWNAEAKTLEKLPKFKVGNVIKQIGSDRHYIIKNIEFDRYILNNNQFIRFTDEHIYELVPIIEDKNWELVPNKFDITTLKPFESKVLVRDCNSHEWEGEIFTRYANKSFNNCNFVTLGGSRWKQCIPYEGNEYLLGKTNDCDEYFKIWGN